MIQASPHGYGGHYDERAGPKEVRDHCVGWMETDMPLNRNGQRTHIRTGQEARRQRRSWTYGG